MALQFEWQWQHGTRKTLGTVQYSKNQKSLGYVRLLSMLKDLLVTPLWSRLELTVHFLEQGHMNQFESLRTEQMTARSRLVRREDIDHMHKVPKTSAVVQGRASLLCNICRCEVAPTGIDHMNSSSSSSSSIGSSSSDGTMAANLRRMWGCAQAACPGYNAHILCMSREAIGGNMVGSSSSTITSSSSSSSSSSLLNDRAIPRAVLCPMCGSQYSWAACVRDSYCYNGGAIAEDEDEEEDGGEGGEGDDGDERGRGRGKSKRRRREDPASVSGGVVDGGGGSGVDGSGSGGVGGGVGGSGVRGQIAVSLLSDEEEEEDEEGEGERDVIYIDSSSDDDDDASDGGDGDGDGDGDGGDDGDGAR